MEEARRQFVRLSALTFILTLYSGCSQAHSNVRIEELFGSGPISKQLALEVDLEVRRAKAALKEFLPVFPDLLNSVKTEIAARFLLHKHRSLLEDAFEAGSINSRCGIGTSMGVGINGAQSHAFSALLTHPHPPLDSEYEAMIKEVDSSLVKLYDHTYVRLSLGHSPGTRTHAHAHRSSHPTHNAHTTHTGTGTPRRPSPGPASSRSCPSSASSPSPSGRRSSARIRSSARTSLCGTTTRPHALCVCWFARPRGDPWRSPRLCSPLLQTRLAAEPKC